MSKDPYKVLGVSPNASDEDIKRAYHDLARKYHPDRYTNSDLADLAKEKMQEVNAAYDEIQRMRAEGGHQTAGNGGTNGNANAGGGCSYGNGAGSRQGQQYSADAREKFVLIRNCINAGNIPEAERLISEVNPADRGAEWHFLMGCIQLRKGFYTDAQFSFDTAYRMEPTNNEYWQFKERMSERSRNFGNGYNTTRGGGCNGCDVCSSLLIADCCCECMGGDLISCC